MNARRIPSRSTTAALFAAVMASAAGHDASAAQRGYTKVVDDATLRPDTGQPFAVYGATVDAGVVAFINGAYGASLPPPDSVWSWSRGTFTRLATLDTPVPSGNGTFTRFDVAPLVRGGIIVFRGLDADSNPGLYAVHAEGGAVFRLVDTHSTIPGTSVTFDAIDFPNTAFDGETVVFAGSGSDGSGSASGIYAVTIGGALTRVADSNTPVNSDTCDAFPVYNFGSPSIDAGNIAFRGNTVFDSSNGFNAIYGDVIPDASTSPGCPNPYPSVANSAEPLPGDPTVAFHTRFGTPEVADAHVIFSADDANSDPHMFGLYTAPLGAFANGGPIGLLVDVNTALPGIGPMAASPPFAATPGNVFFVARDASNAYGAYVLRGDVLIPFAVTGDTLDGRTIANLSLGTSYASNTSASADDVIVRVGFNDFTAGYYLMSEVVFGNGFD